MLTFGECEQRRPHDEETCCSCRSRAGRRRRAGATLVVSVAKANHRVPTGAAETYTLTDARVRFHHGVSAVTPPAGSRVTLGGTITRLRNKHCSTTGFTPTITVRRVDVRGARK